MYSLLCTFIRSFSKVPETRFVGIFFVIFFFFCIFPRFKLFSPLKIGTRYGTFSRKLFTRTVAKTKKSAKRQRRSEGATLLRG